MKQRLTVCVLLLVFIVIGLSCATSQKEDKPFCTISVMTDQKIKINGRPVKIDEFMDNIPRPHFLIRADNSVPFSLITEITEQLNKAGYENISVTSTK